jgi:hypothetical protein
MKTKTKRARHKVIRPQRAPDKVIRPPRARHKVIRLRLKLALRRRRLGYLIGKQVIDHRFKMIAMSIASAGFPVIARVISDIGFLSPAWGAGLVLMGAVVGVLVLNTLVHGWLERHFAAFKSAKFLGLGLLGLTTFIAHGQAVGEVNAIFQVDASALPHTTTAAAAMVIGAWLSWAVLLPVFIVSLACAAFFFVKSRPGDFMIAIAIFFASSIWGALLSQQAAPELRRKSNLYQLALEMDFNKRSHCVGLPEGAEGVLFIGPDQRRAIVAPRKVMIETRGNFDKLVPQIEIPSDFHIVDCK